mmetsp:Transcript_48749/g.136393  ORF Transcript_48749/g.136393 Transcript_48749/m.136393 type:complete len:200 (-) Transcript_48749:125-724(-)
MRTTFTSTTATTPLTIHLEVSSGKRFRSTCSQSNKPTTGITASAKAKEPKTRATSRLDSCSRTEVNEGDLPFRAGSSAFSCLPLAESRSSEFSSGTHIRPSSGVWSKTQPRPSSNFKQVTPSRSFSVAETLKTSPSLRNLPTISDPRLDSRLMATRVPLAGAHFHMVTLPSLSSSGLRAAPVVACFRLEGIERKAKQPP